MNLDFLRKFYNNNYYITEFFLYMYVFVNRLKNDNIKIYIDYKLDENSIYNGYFAFNFSTKNIFFVRFINNYILNYFKNKLDLKKYILFINYISFDKNTFKKQIYFTDYHNYIVSNNLKGKD